MYGPDHDPALWLDLKIALKNVGRGIAEDLFVLFDVVKMSFKCRESPFFRNGWDVTKDESGAWEGPTMVVSQPSFNRLPPGGTMNFCFGLVESGHPSEFNFEITIGSRGGPGSSMRLYITQQNIQKVSEIYSKTPKSERHKPYIRKKMAEKLSQKP